MSATSQLIKDLRGGSESAISKDHKGRRAQLWTAKPRVVGLAKAGDSEGGKEGGEKAFFMDVKKQH